MSEAIEQPGQAALPRPLGIGEILSTAFQLYRRHWRTLLAIAAVVVVPLTLLQHLLGDLARTQRETASYGGVVTVTPTWLGAIAGLLAALAGILMSGVLTTARVNLSEAEFLGNHCVVAVSSFGSLIHTAVGSAGGVGGLRTKRSGCSA